MGVAVHARRIAVGTKDHVWFLAGAPDIARRVEPANRYDAAFVTRSCHVTGEIQGHDMAWAGDELWIVNTLFSCLCTLKSDYSFVPRWKPSFISGLAAEDRCHLNGMAVDALEPRYVTALGQTDAPQGWRPGKAHGGCLLDVGTGQVISQDLCMPHSPRLHDSQLWLLNSGCGSLSVMQPSDGKLHNVAELPGYTRGLALFDQYAFVGLSKIRETSTFGGMPIAQRRKDLKCGVWIVHCGTGNVVAFLEFQTGIEEIFDVKLLVGITSPLLSGPFGKEDGDATIWMVPVNGLT
jgi:uncharacterized protein (TIGR03032 family)